MNPPTPEAITVNDQAIEQEIQAKGLTAPRVTPADLKANIAHEHYFTAADGVQAAGAVHLPAGEGWTLGSLQLLTICVLVLRNGFTVTGESACASPENFDAEVGRKIARDNAVAKVWPLMGYALKQQLYVAENGPWPCQTCRDAFPAGDALEAKSAPVQAE